MDTINLQNKTSALPGIIQSYWFENEHIGLAKTLFHKIEIPLQLFDSGLDYDSQPTDTVICFDWYKLELDDPSVLDGINFSHEIYSDAEASVYIGCAHNWCHVKTCLLEAVGENEYKVTADIVVEFENERVAKNESFKFSTTAKYVKA